MFACYVITDDARDDLLGIEDFVLSYADEAFVDKLEDEFFETFEHLLREALMHPVYRFDPDIALTHEYRSVNVYNYKVFYYLRDDCVVIYRVMHLASDFTRPAW